MTIQGLGRIVKWRGFSVFDFNANRFVFCIESLTSKDVLYKDKYGFDEVCELRNIDGTLVTFETEQERDELLKIYNENLNKPCNN